MKQKPDLRSIMSDIERRYESLQKPDFHFVQEALEAEQWKHVEQELRTVAEVNETTDPNSDVSRTFVLAIGGKSEATLQLSLVGPYGVFFRHDDERGSDIFIAAAYDTRHAWERAVVELCQRNGIQLLDKQSLTVPVPLKLFNASQENVRVYQALFSDVEFMPGEYG